MNTDDQILDTLFSNDYLPLFMQEEEAFKFLRLAVSHGFNEVSWRYYFDKNKRELFKSFIFLESYISGQLPENAEISLTQEQLSGYKERLIKIGNDPGIIEIPRLSQDDWDWIFSKVLINNKTSPDQEQIINNYILIRENEYKEQALAESFIMNVQDQKIVDECNLLISLAILEKIFLFLWENRVSDEPEKIIKGITIFDYSYEIRGKKTVNNPDKIFKTKKFESKETYESREEVEQKVREITVLYHDESSPLESDGSANYKPEEEFIKYIYNSTATHGWNLAIVGMALVNYGASLEETFKIEIPDDDFEGFTDFDSIVDYICDSLNLTE